jgi:hypothetical protein
MVSLTGMVTNTADEVKGGVEVQSASTDHRRGRVPLDGDAVQIE